MPAKSRTCRFDPELRRAKVSALDLCVSGSGAWIVSVAGGHLIGIPYLKSLPASASSSNAPNLTLGETDRGDFMNVHPHKQSAHSSTMQKEQREIVKVGGYGLYSQ